MSKHAATGALTFFVKTPGLSPIKTRLASSVGEDIAARFYQVALEITRDLGKQLKILYPKLTIYWAVAEPAGLKNPLWKDFPAISQGDGPLGERLHHIYDFCLSRHSFAALMGADCLHWEPAQLAQAFDDLAAAKSDFLLGPCEDGGFYLMAGKESLPKSVWLDTPYSVEFTSSVLSEHLKRLGSLRHLEKLFDVDTAQDLRRLASLSTRFPHLLRLSDFWRLTTPR